MDLALDCYKPSWIVRPGIALVRGAIRIVRHWIRTVSSFRDSEMTSFFNGTGILVTRFLEKRHLRSFLAAADCCFY